MVYANVLSEYELLILKISEWTETIVHGDLYCGMYCLFDISTHIE